MKRLEQRSKAELIAIIMRRVPGWDGHALAWPCSAYAAVLNFHKYASREYGQAALRQPVRPRTGPISRGSSPNMTCLRMPRRRYTGRLAICSTTSV